MVARLFLATEARAFQKKNVLWDTKLILLTSAYLIKLRQRSVTQVWAGSLHNTFHSGGLRFVHNNRIGHSNII